MKISTVCLLLAVAIAYAGVGQVRAADTGDHGSAATFASEQSAIADAVVRATTPGPSLYGDIELV